MSESLWRFLRARAVQIEQERHLHARLVSGDRLRVKLGLDPTAPDIHVGHLVVLDVLRAFQEAGHTVVLIIGDYTAMIGDPSGRSETRPMLTREQVDENARTYFEQVYMVLDPDRTEVHGNAEWLGEMTAADILRLLGTGTLQQVLQREDFAKRLREGQPIGAHEILYPFSQAYDSVAVRADVEIGGTDQLFNLLFGREVQRAYGQEPQDIAVFPLLEGLDGVQKMSKSLDNYIGISEPADQIYGKTMSIPDALTERYLRLVSGLPEKKLGEVLQRGPRDAKAALARRLVARLHGEEAAEAAEAEFDRRFRQRTVAAEDVPTVEVPSGATVEQAIVGAGLAPTISQARKLFPSGALAGDRRLVLGEEVTDGMVLKIGKHRFIRVATK